MKLWTSLCLFLLLGATAFAVRENPLESRLRRIIRLSNTDAGVAGLIKLVLEKDVLSAEHRKFLSGIMLKTSTGTDKIKQGLPPGVMFGHKTGSSSRTADGIKIADNDAGFVTLTNGRTYYIAVMITESKLDDRANAALDAQISQTVYNYLTTEKTD